MAETGIYEAMRTLRAGRRLRPEPIPVPRRVFQLAIQSAAAMGR